MQTSQVSVWVPIMVGIIGLIGIIAGQLVNAWREDRRWKREQQREDVRWAREHDRETTRRAHDDMIDWRDRRLSAYGDYLQAIDELLDTAIKWPIVAGTDKAAASADGYWSKKWYGQLGQISRLGQTVKLMCGQPLRELLESDTISQVREQMTVRLQMIRKKAEKERVPLPGSGLFPYRDELIELMRNELGANPPTSTISSIGGP